MKISTFYITKGSVNLAEGSGLAEPQNPGFGRVLYGYVPTRVEPVKDSAATSGLSQKACPTSEALP